MVTSAGWPARLQGNGVETFAEWAQKYRGRDIRDEYHEYHDFEELLEDIQSRQRFFKELYVRDALAHLTFDQYEFISEDGYRFTQPDREE